MKTLNLQQPFSRLPISQGVEMIAPTLLKAILKFCITNKLFEGIFAKLQEKVWGSNCLFGRKSMREN